MKRNPIQIDRLERPDPALFRREYLAKQKPLILTGLVREWPASRWTPPGLKERFGGTPLRYETWDGDESINDPHDFFRRQRYHWTTLGKYVDKMIAAQGPSRRFYSAQIPFLRTMPELAEDLGSLEAYMDIPTWYPRRLRALVKHEPLMWLGPAGTLSTLHFDKTHNFFVQLYGRKKWIVVPPEQSSCVYWPCATFGARILHWSPVDVEHPDKSRFPRFERATPVELLVEPGEVLFVPVSWWHFVRALDASISLNYFWLRPLDSVLALRRYFLHYAVRVIRGARGGRVAADR